MVSVLVLRMGLLVMLGVCGFGHAAPARGTDLVHDDAIAAADFEDVLRRIERLEQADPARELDSLLDETLARAIAAKLPRVESIVRSAIARHAGRRGDFARMLAEAERALLLAVDLGDVELMHDAKLGIGGAAQNLGDYERAAKVLAELQRELAETRSETAARLWLTLSSLLARTGDRAGALVLVERGKALTQELGLTALNVQFLLNRLRMADANDAPAARRQWGQEAEALARRLARPELLATVLLAMAGIERDANEWVLARVSAAEALALARSIKHVQLQEYALNSLAQIDEKEGKFESAEARIREALGMVDSQERRVELDQRLAQFLFDRGRFEESAASFRAALQSHGEWSRDLRSAALLDLSRAVKDTGQLQHEARSAQRRADLAERDQQRIWMLGLMVLLVFSFGITVAGIWYYRRKNALVTAEAQASARMLAFASHEVRNPVHGIAGLSELLLRSPLNPQQQTWAETILRAAEHLGRIADDFLQHARLRLGKGASQKQPTDLRDLLATVVALDAPMARAAGVSLATEVGDAVPHWVMADPARLRQVLLNLLGNAIRYSGGNRVQLSAQAESDGIRFAVSDNGLGMGDSELARVFEPFVQGDQGQQLPGGSGLGLSICKDLVEVMGGTIDVRSQQGAGTQFAFKVRLDACPAPRVRRSAVAHSFLSLKVLVVDDDVANLTLAVAQLQHLGHHATGFQQPGTALQWFAANLPDLVIVDYQMPQMDGVSLAREIRKLGRHAFKIMAVSGHDRGQSTEQNEMDSWLLKPVSLAQLAAAIHRLFNPTGPGVHVPEVEAVSPGSNLLDPARLNELRKLQSQGTSVFQSLVEGFIAGSPDRLAQVRAAFQSRDHAALAGYVHRWRGTAASLGAQALAETLASIESDALSDAAGADAKLVELEHVLANTCEALRAELAR